MDIAFLGTRTGFGINGCENRHRGPNSVPTNEAKQPLKLSEWLGALPRRCLYDICTQETVHQGDVTRMTKDGAEVEICDVIS